MKSADTKRCNNLFPTCSFFKTFLIILIGKALNMQDNAILWDSAQSFSWPQSKLLSGQHYIPMIFVVPLPPSHFCLFCFSPFHALPLLLALFLSHKRGSLVEPTFCHKSEGMPDLCWLCKTASALRSTCLHRRTSLKRPASRQRRH